MFQLIDADVRELPIVIDFNAWLKTRHTLDAHMPKVSVRITIIRTEMFGEDDYDGKLPWESTTLATYEYGRIQLCKAGDFAAFLQYICPIPLVGKDKNVNHWYNLLNFAKAEAIDWRRAKAKGMPDSVGTGS